MSEHDQDWHVRRARPSAAARCALGDALEVFARRVEAFRKAGDTRARWEALGLISTAGADVIMAENALAEAIAADAAGRRAAA